jgi:hypothetical protein
MATDSRRWIAAIGPLFLLAGGCVTLDSKARDLPTGTPIQAAAMWQTFVLFSPDPAREGAMTPGLAGRLYLYGSQSDVPIVAPGKVQVRLYPDLPDGKKVDTPLEVWELDPDTLKGKLQHDIVGWGYSLLLPWGTYRPDLTHVRMTVRFEPAKGGPPLFAQETRLSLHGEGPPPIVSTTSTAVASPAQSKQSGSTP